MRCSGIMVDPLPEPDGPRKPRLLAPRRMTVSGFEGVAFSAHETGPEPPLLTARRARSAAPSVGVFSASGIRQAGTHLWIPSRLFW